MKTQGCYYGLEKIIKKFQKIFQLEIIGWSTLLKKIGTGVGNFNLIRKNFKNNFEKFENFRNWGNFTVSISPTKKLIDEKNILNSGVFFNLTR